MNINSVRMIVAKFIKCLLVANVLVAKLIGHIAPELANIFGLLILILPANSKLSGIIHRFLQFSV